MPLAPNITCTNSDTASNVTAMVAIRRRKEYISIRVGRALSIHEAASASACGARSTTARRPSSGRGNRVILGKRFT